MNDEPIREEIHLHDSVAIELLEFAEIKDKIPGRNKPVSELQTGRTMSYSGHVVEKKRLIDRQADWYAERIIDVATGDVWHDVAYPLSSKRSPKKHR